MKTAIEALPFERPNLAVTAVLNVETQLDRAIEASRQLSGVIVVVQRPLQRVKPRSSG